MLITCENISKAYTDKVLLDNQTLTISANEKIGIIGVNGCGKSTLLKIIAKIEEPDKGDVIYEKFKKNNLGRSPRYCGGNSRPQFIWSHQFRPLF